MEKVRGNGEIRDEKKGFAQRQLDSRSKGSDEMNLHIMKPVGWDMCIVCVTLNVCNEWGESRLFLQHRHVAMIMAMSHSLLDAPIAIIVYHCVSCRI
jgi:hypothetical protein